MTATVVPVTDRTPSTTPLALVVSLGLGALLTVIVVALASSTANTPSSIDGDSATYSQFIPGSGK